MRYYSILLATAIFIGAGCSQTPSEPGPLQYAARYSGNVSTLYGQDSIARTGPTDGYAPNFYWRNSNGDLDSLTGQRGRVVLLNFWATWCPPCVSEMPELEQIQKQYGDSVLVLGVSVDYPGDAFSLVKQFVDKNNFHYQIVVDSAYTLFSKYLQTTTSDIPETYLIDTHGGARYSFVGEQQKQTFLTYIEKARKY